MKRDNFLIITKSLKILILLISFVLVFNIAGCQYLNGSEGPETPEAPIDNGDLNEDKEPSNQTGGEEIIEEDLNPFDFVLSFAGDINFDENWATMKYYNTAENGIYDCISPELIELMKEADIMCLNNEFTYSTGGTPLKGKAYTFRAHPSRVEILKEMGVDIVSLANNHAYDYGPQSLIDTMATLK